MKASSPAGRGRVQTIKAKTEKLIQLKKQYNAEVAEVAEVEGSLTFRLATSLMRSLTNSLWWFIRS